MPVVVVSSNQFNQMQSFKTLKCNQKERQQLKHSFIDKIKENVSLRWNRAKKLVQVIDEIIYKATDRGYSFNGRETLAKKCNVGLSTVDKAIKVIKESGIAVVAYRENPSSNGYKTPIIILKNHPHFQYLNELLGLEQSIEQKVEKLSTADAPIVEGVKKIATYILPFKQESNIYNQPDNKIVQYVINRVQDSIKQGTKIKYLSSYVDRIVGSLEQQAIYAENKRLKQQQQQREEESLRLAEELGIKKRYSLKEVYYDYLK